MTRQRHSIDGFVPRRQGAPLGGLQKNPTGLPPVHPAGSPRREIGDVRPLINEHEKSGETLSAKEEPKRQISSGGISRAEIDESLQGIDVPREEVHKRKRKLSAKQIKRIIKWLLILILVVGIGMAAYVGFRALIASGNIFKGNVFDILQSKPLKTDANGRSNILIFGTAEDDEGGTHEGGNLTDSLMVVSVDQKKKDAFMLSIPRDLWVRYAETCTVGNEGKINAAYFCASDDGANEEVGANALRQQIGKVVGLDVQYYAHLNFTAVVETVDAVGGVEVTIESDDPRGVLDRNFDWKCGYKCYYVNYKNGQKVHLDGEHALALARARNASGGYGLSGGNFDREKNQQKIIRALQQKAISVGTLTNVGKVTGLIDALGRNLRTNFETGEIRTLMDLGQTIKQDSIHQLTLVNEDEPLVTTGSYNGQSIVRPVAGIMDYSDIQSYVRKSLNSNPVTREEAKITVLNGSDVAGAAGKEAEKLEAQGMIVDDIANAPDGSYGKVTIYQIDPKKKATAAKLKQMYGVKLLTTTPPVTVTGDTAFVVIVGTIANTTSSN